MIACLLCRLRGHDDAVAALAGTAAELWCTRCGRRQLVHSLVPTPPTLVDQAAAAGIALVDQKALELLWAVVSVEAALADMEAARLDGGGS